ncbi:MAG: alpha/beta hydrolase [Pseudonocardia sp.]|nr:alpha/beta hydrolase [Pseudonocardia sp.]
MHSWSYSSSIWEYQFQRFLDAGFRCVAMDRRGHGRSDEPGVGYDLDTLADDLAGLFEHLDLRGVTLVGHSMGTMEITRYLARHGTTRVTGAAYLGAMTPYLAKSDDNPGGLEPHFLDAIIRALKEDRPKWFSDGAPAYFATGTTGSWVSEALVDDAIQSILRTPLEVQIACLRIVFGSDLRAELRSIEIPTLVLHGDADVSAPIDLTGRPTAALLPNSRLLVYPGAPHGLYVTERDRITNDLLEFARAGVGQPRLAG